MSSSMTKRKPPSALFAPSATTSPDERCSRTARVGRGVPKDRPALPQGEVDPYRWRVRHRREPELVVLAGLPIHRQGLFGHSSQRSGKEHTRGGLCEEGARG